MTNKFEDDGEWESDETPQWEEGFKAYGLGTSRGHNPYSDFCDEFDQWEAGWLTAEAEDLGEDCDDEGWEEE